MVQPSSRRKGVAKRLLRHVQRRACQVGWGCLKTVGVPSKSTAYEENIWVVATQIFFYFHPYLGKIPILANIFQRG